MTLLQANEILKSDNKAELAEICRIEGWSVQVRILQVIYNACVRQSS